MLSLCLLSLLCISAAFAIPVDHARSLLLPRLNLCNIPPLSCFACKNDEVQLLTTPMGLARGVQTTAGAVKFTVKYATAARFRPPVLATSWILPFVALPVLGTELTSSQS
jgi:hypothetical protein